MSTSGTTITTQTPPANPCPCNSWYCWLQSWASPGGNLVLLSILTVLLLTAMVLLMIKYGPGAPVVITIVSIASAYAGAITTRMGITSQGSSTTTRTPDQH